MRFSFGLPTCMEGMMYPVPFATPEQVVELAVHAEQLGYHSVWGNDHMTTQRYVREEYETPPMFWELLTTLAYIAAETNSLRLATGVLVPAMRRDIVVMAKQLATIDRFSDGRLMVGMGIGAYREEFEALHPDYQVHRGDLLEESIGALRALFNERNASWSGEYYQFQDVEMFPKPKQNPLPIYVGGNNINAVRRTAAHGQGWMGAAMPVDQLAEKVETLKTLAQQHGRDPESIEVAPQFVAAIGASHETAASAFRESQMHNHLVSLGATTLKEQVAAGARFEEINLIGGPDDILEKVERLRAVGVTHFSGILFAANSVAEMKDQMQQFAESVIDKLAA